MFIFRIPTDSGFCCALNTKQLLSESRYRDLILEINRFETETINISDGINNGLRIILDLHSNQVSFGTLETEFDAFSVFLGRPDDFPMMKRKSLKIQPGQEHFIEISGTKVRAKDIRTLPPETRQCYFSDEGEKPSSGKYPSLYSRYTADNCKLECRMREAEKAVGCVPWYLPQVSSNVNNLPKTFLDTVLNKIS